MKSIFLFTLYLTAALVLAACTPQSSPQALPSPVETGQTVSQAPSRATTQDEWNKVLLDTRKERTITIYSSIGAEIRQVLGEAFKKKYSIEVEFTTAKGNEIAQKVMRERQMGIYIVDVYIGGITDVINTLIPGGHVAPLKQFLVLPEVKDPEAWWRPDGWPKNELLWVDKDRNYVLAFVATPQSVLAVNTDQVKANELTTYRDLLNPQWKEKIVMNDPTVSGSGLVTFRTIERLMGGDFMVKLADQKPVIIRDQRLQAEWLARGKYSIAIGPKSETIGEFKDAGSPLSFKAPAEGVAVTGGSGTVAVLNKAPHPNGAKLFVNWLLTQEGQAIFARAGYYQSARLDVKADYLDPGKTRQPGEKYFYQYTEDFLSGQSEATKRAQEIFGPLIK